MLIEISEVKDVVLGGFWKPFPDENWATLLSTCSANDKKKQTKCPKNA